MVKSRDARNRVKETSKNAVQTITKPIGGEKNGGERVVVVKKGSKWYPADDVKKPVPTRKHVHKPTKLRKSIRPGSVLILLSGVYSGMRVVFLKQLASGLLLVTGPFCVNGIPLRRVDQRYVIATRTVVDIAAVDVSKIDDTYFKRSTKPSPPSEKAVTGQDEYFDSDAGKAKKELTDEKRADQKEIDAALLPAIEKHELLKDYLRSRFTLHKGQYPHLMQF